MSPCSAAGVLQPACSRRWASAGCREWAAVSTSQRHQRRGSRAPPTVQASLGKQLAAAAALGVTAFAVRKLLQERSSMLQQTRQQQRDAESSSDRRRGGHSNASSSLSSGDGASASSRRGPWMPVQLSSLRWPLHSKEHDVQQAVQAIEAQRYREAQQELWQWDQRYRLRAKPVDELRRLARDHNISGRSRMRKQELVAALEAALGYAPHHHHQQQQAQ